MNYPTIDTEIKALYADTTTFNPFLTVWARVQVFLKRATVLHTQYYYPLERISLLPLADFTIFNETYGTQNHDTCGTCNGCGGFITGEMQGDGHMTGWIETFECCNDCIGAELCPGCMQPLTLSFDLSAFDGKTEWVAYDNPYYATNLGYLKRSFDYEDALSAMPFEGFICSCCGWTYDPACNNEQYYDEPNYYEDDYPALDASDMFPF